MITLVIEGEERVMGDVPRISDAEWEIMRVVWDRHPIEAGEVAKVVCARRDWSERTVKSLLSRLVHKGALGYRRREQAKCVD